MTHTVSIVLNIAADKADEFERAFEEHEVPTWRDLHAKGKLLRASLSPLWKKCSYDRYSRYAPPSSFTHSIRIRYVARIVATVRKANAPTRP